MSIGLKANADGSGAVQIGGTDAVSISAALGITFATGVDGDFKMNSGYGSIATAFGCRAWVNFNGTGVVAIRASGNVSSITDNGTGDYTANFTTALPDANYSWVGSCMTNNTSVSIRGTVQQRSNQTSTTSALPISTMTGDTSTTSNDVAVVNLAIFR